MNGEQALLTNVSTGPTATRVAGRGASTASARSAGRWILHVALILVWAGVVGPTLYWALEYYLTPFSERPFSALHDLFKPSGLIGLGFGIVGTAFITFGVSIYILRKRVRWLRGLGKLKHWLTLHIFLCTMGPVLVLFHTAFRVTGLISIGFWCMTVVALSGFFGRYVYAHIPKTINGQFLTLQRIQEQKQELVDKITQDFGIDAGELEELLSMTTNRKPRGFLHAFVLAVRYDVTKRSLKRNIRKYFAHEPRSTGTIGIDQTVQTERPLCLRDSVLTIVESELELERQLVLLAPLQLLFRFWHIMHIPLSIVMFLVVALHIGIAVLFGYAWVF